MAEKELTFTCWKCQQETTVIVPVSKQLATQPKPVPVVRYCEHCQCPNKLPVPDNIAVHMFILGRDKGFLGYTPQGTPRVQGEKCP